MSDVLDVGEACDYLKIAKPTLYRYLRAGQIPAFKMGRIWKFHKESLDSWIRASVKESTELRSNRGVK